MPVFDINALVQEADARTEEIVSLASELIRIDSQNNPPYGQEGPCQAWVHDFLCAAGVESRIVSLDQAPGLADHPLYWSGRDYANRPNVLARLSGSGNGRSLLFSGHIDTMPPSPGTWRFGPFTPHLENGDLYGLGACDMKGGLAAALFVLKLFRERRLKPGADLLFESVVDEEHAGCNGTLANRLLGHQAEGAVLPEPSGLELYTAHKGFRIVHVRLKGKGGISFSSEKPVNPVEYVGELVAAMQDFRALRARSVAAPAAYADDPDPVPVMLPKLQAGEFGFRVPMQIPEDLCLEVYWQTLPGETQGAVEKQFFDFMEERLAGTALARHLKVEYSFSLRWMPGTEVSPAHPFVATTREALAATLDCPPVVRGAPYPCDLFVFNHFGIPAVVLGPRGRNPHAPDEQVEVASLRALAGTFLRLTAAWCGLEECR